MNKLNYIKDIRELSILLAGKKESYTSIKINILVLYNKLELVYSKDFKKDFDFFRKKFDKKSHDEYIQGFLELIIYKTSEEDLMRILIDIFTLETIQKLYEFFYIDKLQLLTNNVVNLLKDFSDEVGEKINQCGIDLGQLSRIFLDIGYGKDTIENITDTIENKENIQLILYKLLNEYRHLGDKLHKYLYLLANKLDTYNYGLSGLVRLLINTKLENDEVRNFRDLVQNKLRLDFNILKKIILSIEEYKCYTSVLNNVNDLYELFSSDLICEIDSKTKIVRKITPLLEKYLSKKEVIEGLKNKLIKNNINTRQLWCFLKKFGYYDGNIENIIELRIILCKNISEYIDEISFNLDINDDFLYNIKLELLYSKNKSIKKRIDKLIKYLEEELVSVKSLSYLLREFGYIKLDQSITCRNDNVRNFMIDALNFISIDVDIKDMIKTLISHFKNL